MRRILALLAGLLLMSLFGAPVVLAAEGSVLPALAPTDLLGVAGASIVTTILVGVILNAWRPTADTRDRFGPLLCLVVAEAVTIAASIATGGDVTNAVLVGILVTGGADFTHSLAQAATTN